MISEYILQAMGDDHSLSIDEIHRRVVNLGWTSKSKNPIGVLRVTMSKSSLFVACGCDFWTTEEKIEARVAELRRERIPPFDR